MIFIVVHAPGPLPMPRQKPPQPTDAELEILQVLWTRGPSTVRDVHESMATRDVRYTTVLKTMQVMHDKDLLDRDESERSHVYSAKLKQAATQRQLVREFMDRVFDGATEQLVLHALSAREVTPDELAEIRRMLDDYDRRRR
jgi:predicted transcriptional regulator